MRNLILPAEYSQDKLKKAKQELLTKAKSRESKEIQLCGNAKSWDDCFSGFTKGNIYTLLFQYNIGVNTFAVCGEFNIWD